MDAREIFVVAATRTAIGTFGGSLKDVPLTALATTAPQETTKKRVVQGWPGARKEPTSPRRRYTKRVAAVRPKEMKSTDTT